MSKPGLTGPSYYYLLDTHQNKKFYLYYIINTQVDQRIIFICGGPTGPNHLYGVLVGTDYYKLYYYY
jgi:hypothetical protein